MMLEDSDQECHQLTVSLLNFLGQVGYRVSRKKAQIEQEKVRYLAFDISQGQRALDPERKEAICRTVVPRTKRQLRGFLGMAGFCRIWIPNFGLIAKALYEGTTGREGELQWTAECRKSFNTIKRAVMTAPALGLPDLSKPFQLYVHERQGVTSGVLTQHLGSWKRPVAYFSKKLDPTSLGWPACLRTVAATAMLVEEAKKLTLGQPMTVYTPHSILTVVNAKGGTWLSPGRMAKYQVALLDQGDINLQISSTLNPATLLPVEQDEELRHDCIETIKSVHASRPDLKDTPLLNADLELYTDGSSFMENGIRRAGYAVVTSWDTVEAGALPPNMSAQRAELIALTRALHLAKGKTATIYTDSKYAFGVLHAHGAIWKERVLLTANKSPGKYRTEILRLLEAVMEPVEVAVVHCKAHQKGDSEVIKGNWWADAATKGAAREPVQKTPILALVPQVVLSRRTPEVH
ncbi:endogenous retrovirus group K member 18 Pol protein-like [Alligator mississippiensis]|uniref:Endogenous retrovirus group K member 18 Pol protein-like n=1 Tax=Alligator mississippiensis TaxID=8496 RepID=A0A151MMX5_ALLMI|nr:endogenous retrovirus group K member 18 Pol protein-like [Alligator mississippiensis]